MNMATAGSVAPAGVGIHEDVHVTGRRVLAIIVDGLLVGIPTSFISMLLFGTSSVYGSSTTDASQIGLVSLSLVVFFLYYTLLEGYLGQTVGKMLLGIKVIREDTGEVPGVGAAAIRTVLRLIDGLFGYLVGFIAVLASAKTLPLGDMAAHTLVVRK